MEGVIAVTDFSLLTQVQSTNSGFFFVALKPWEARKRKEEQLEYIQSNLQKRLFMNPDGIAFAFPPPSIPGLGTSGGVTMILEDRSGSDDPATLTKNVFTFLGAISKRPEIAAAIPSYQPAVPQLYADVDREKALQQQVDLTNIYTTMQTFMGGYLVNYFNRFGRQWQTYVEADGESRTSIENINRFYVRSANGSQVPLGSLVKVKQITGPEFIFRFNEFNAAQLNITGAPGYSSGQVRKALEEVFHQTMPPGAGFDYSGMSYQEQVAEKGVPSWAVFGLSLTFVFLILAGLYESWTLPFSVLLSTPVAILGRVPGASHARARERRLRHHRSRHAHRALCEERNPHRGVREAELRRRPEHLCSGAQRCPPAIQADRDDGPGIHRRLSASRGGHRFGSRGAPHPGYGGRRRHDAVHGAWPHLHPRDLLGRRVPFASIRSRRLRRHHGLQPGTGVERWKKSFGGRDACRCGGRLSVNRFFQSNRLAWYGFVALISLSLAACKVGPNYVRPQLTAPPAFRGADDAQVSSDPKNSLGDEQWSAVYQEPELQQLIRKALINNYDVRIAAQHILEQQAQVRIVRSQEFPTVSVGGTGIGATLPSSLGNQISSPLVAGSFNLSAAWTPDFWGLYRRQTEAARAQLLAQTWAQRAVRLTLVQQVATLYLEIRALDRQLEITKQTIKVRQDSLDLTKALESGGSVPLSDVRQAEQLLYAATSQVPQIEQQIQQLENAISLLLGENPGPIAHTDPHALTAPPQDLPTGLPSQLLERRPDIQEAEATLIAANAQIGVARAQFFPSLSISASAGVGGDSLSQYLRYVGKDHLRHRLSDPTTLRGRQAAGSA